VNKKALLYGLIYSLFVISIKLSILLGGYSLSRFGFYYSNIVCVILILPFYYLGIKSIRDNLNGGFIGGRDASRIALTIFAVSALLIGVYNYFEFEYNGKALAIDYYNGAQFLEYLKSQKNIKLENYTKIIAEQIKISESSSFKATTGKLFSSMLIGISSAFIMASIMKKNK
jgi:hypothetical protein